MRKSANLPKIIPAAVCAALALFAGIKLYFTPTTHINIDINPSLDLGINLFDRVVSINALNDDGKKLIMEMPNIKFTAYDEALRRILDNKSVESMLSEDGIMTVTVIETNTAQSENILSAVSSCAGGYGRIHCHSVSHEDASEASRLGLSYERYLAYLNLHFADPGITPESVRNMSMHEIEYLTQLQFNDHDNDHSEYDDHDNTHSDYDDHNEHNSYNETESNYSVPTGNGHHGYGHGHEHE